MMLEIADIKAPGRGALADFHQWPLGEVAVAQLADGHGMA